MIDQHVDSRRSFMASVAQGLLGVGSLPLLEEMATAAPATTKARAKSVIYLYMNGGMSHLDTFDTKPGAETQGPVESIKTNVPGIKLSEYLPKMAHQMDKVAVINSLSSTQGAHTQGRYFMHTSYFQRGTIAHPDLGAWTSRALGRLNPTLPANIKIGGSRDSLGGGFLESNHAALPIGDPSAGLQHSSLPKGVTQERFQRRLARVHQMNKHYEERYDQKDVRAITSMYDSAVKLMKSDDLMAFDLSLESKKAREAYGKDAFGQGCLLARRLVENQVRFIEVELGGWDTHVNNFEQVPKRARVLDRALAALLDDLSTRGLLDQTLVVLATEFGRTPEIDIERDNGRNHYPRAFSGLLAGGGIKGGVKYGQTDAKGQVVEDNLVEIPNFNATIAHAIGVPTEKIFKSPTGRPFKVAHDGQPILELFT